MSQFRGYQSDTYGFGERGNELSTGRETIGVPLDFRYDEGMMRKASMEIREAGSGFIASTNYGGRSYSVVLNGPGVVKARKKLGRAIGQAEHFEQLSERTHPLLEGVRHPTRKKKPRRKNTWW